MKLCKTSQKHVRNLKILEDHLKICKIYESNVCKLRYKENIEVMQNISEICKRPRHLERSFETLW